MNIQQNISLKPYNTFSIQAIAKQFASFTSVAELSELLDESKNESRLILGGGSNILLTKNFDGIILKNELKGIDIIKEDNDNFYVKAAAGEGWHSFVQHCIKNNYAGVENLSLIPGNVGASPMQNIGAYGVEIKDVFHELEAYHIQDKKLVTFNINDCEFGYRESIFKRKYKGQFVITSVTYKLNKTPVYHTSYGAIEQEMERMNVTTLNIAAISQAIINIRQSKLPDPKVIGNAGSFFKNPTIANTIYHQLKNNYPNMPGYTTGMQTKVPAAWLIEQCGFKGYRDGDAGCHINQPLVLVNYGNAKGAEILALSETIINTVNNKFNILLEREVNLV